MCEKIRGMLDNTLSYCLIIAITFLFFLPSESTGIELRADWEYDSSVNGLAGFRLYQNTILACETNDPTARQLICDVPLSFDNGTTKFTLTAYGLNGMESPHSNSFSIIFYTSTPPSSTPLPGDINCNGLIDLKDLHLVQEIVVGSTLRETICLEADVNGDLKLGQEEINYILKHMTQLH